MKKVFGAAMVLVAALATGCSDSGLLKSVDADPTDADPTASANDGTETMTVQQGIEVDLRMRGADAAQFQALMLVPNGVTILADGKPVNVSPTWRAVNLANVEHAEKIATFYLPEDAQRVEFKIDMGAAGGFETLNSGGYIDTRNSVVTFDATGAELKRTQRAVVTIDAARSFVQRDAETMMLVPNFRVD
jgi:hypothetical protein